MNEMNDLLREIEQFRVNEQFIKKKHNLVDKKHAILIASGVPPTLDLFNYYYNNSILIAVDGGANYFSSYNKEPDFVIGDLDGVAVEYSNASYLKFNDQNSNDLTKALEICKLLDIKDITVMASNGMRTDHALANLTILNKYKDHFNISFEDEFSTIFVKDKPFKLRGSNGRKISLIPLFNTVKNISTNGLAYELQNDNLEINAKISSSNHMIKNNIDITFDNGDLLVILEQENIYQ